MSRKRRKRRPRRSDQKERKGYPSLAERERIVERRDKLLRELIAILVTPQRDDRKMEALIWQYGPQEVSLVLERFQQRAARSELIGDEAATYREYRRVFAGFGGSRPFLSWQEYSDLSYEHGMLNVKRTFQSLVSRRPGAREREARDLLLIDAWWDDITPPDVPPRPADFAAPRAGTYDYPTRTLLDWGWNLDDERVKNNARNVNKWRPAIDDLVRMALDEGLLDGWPGEPASWAPYHALNMLGYLRAHGVAGELCGLLGRENDWLSDRLAVAWGWMGPQAEPALWDYVEDRGYAPEQRAIAMLGLRNVARAHPKQRGSVVRRLADLLHRAPAEDAEANAYVAWVLNSLEAVEARETVAKAFEQQKIDDSITAPYDLDILDWGDAELHGRLYRKGTQVPAEDVTFKMGDSVVVKPGVQDPDLDIEIGGWQGRLVKDPDADGLVMIAWDSVTLRNTPDAAIAQCVEQGLDWTQMGLSTGEIEPINPRDSAEDVERAIGEISKKHAWSWLGEEGERIGKVLACIDPDDEMGLLDAWEEYLAENLGFPFEAEISEYQERGPLQAGDRLKVTGIGLVDDLYGIIVDVRRGREKFAFPLCDLEVVDKRSPNYQLVDDYAVWFANR
jgi:hypothetical protein